MDEKTLEKSDKGIGLEFEVKKNTANANRIGFSNTIFDVGEKVYVLSEEQRFDVMKELDNVDEYKARIKELEGIIAKGTTDTNTEDLKAQLQEKDKTITELTNDNSEKDNTIKELVTRVDSLAKELESSSDVKVESVDDIESLKEELKTKESEVEYWKNAFENLMESSDDLANRNEELIKDNEQLKTANIHINETNKLLNDNIIGINNNYKETKNELQSSFDNKEKELKETIQKQQTHIDELTEKVESLSMLKDYIPPKQHYEEIDNLKEKVNDAKLELDKLSAEVDMKLSKQKSEMEVKHTEEKAQMLIAYTQEVNANKLKYNELAKDYNHLLGDANSLSRTSVLFSGRHKTIVKDKEPVELEEIEVEKEPTETIEYVPKDKITLV